MPSQPLYAIGAERLKITMDALQALSMVSHRFKANSPTDLACLLSVDINTISALGKWCADQVAGMLSNWSSTQADSDDPSVHFPPIAYYTRNSRKALIHAPDIMTNLLMVALQIDVVHTSCIGEISKWRAARHEDQDQFLQAATWASHSVRDRFDWVQPEGANPPEIPKHVQLWHKYAIENRPR